jgi:hypothetical protein
MSLLPDYLPPNAQRANLAIGLSPLLVLVTFVALVVRWVDPDTGFAIFAACTIWVVYEMGVFQRTLDSYNQGYIHRHLQWRSSEALLALIQVDRVPEPTRDFVRRFIEADRQFLRDGQVVRTR